MEDILYINDGLSPSDKNKRSSYTIMRGSIENPSDSAAKDNNKESFSKESSGGRRDLKIKGVWPRTASEVLDNQNISPLNRQEIEKTEDDLRGLTSKIAYLEKTNQKNSIDYLDAKKKHSELSIYHKSQLRKCNAIFETESRFTKLKAKSLDKFNSAWGKIKGIFKKK